MSRCERYVKSSNPRSRGCERCGLLPKYHRLPDSAGPVIQAHPAAEYFDEPRTQPRNVTRERELLNVAARAAGLSGDAGLWSFADARAAPGGVRENLDAVQEIAEEVADGVNYACWGIERVYEAMLAGESDATAEYERLMRCLTHLVGAWHALVVR